MNAKPSSEKALLGFGFKVLGSISRFRGRKAPRSTDVEPRLTGALGRSKAISTLLAQKHSVARGTRASHVDPRTSASKKPPSAFGLSFTRSPSRTFSPLLTRRPSPRLDRLDRTLHTSPRWRPPLPSPRARRTARATIDCHRPRAARTSGRCGQRSREVYQCTHAQYRY